MTISNFVMKEELALISFSLSLVKEVKRKIHNQTFFYKKQVDSYIDKKVTFFLQTLAVSEPLKNVYKQQILTIVYNKLKPVIYESIYLDVVSD